MLFVLGSFLRLGWRLGRSRNRVVLEESEAGSHNFLKNLFEVCWNW
jgi:hypothetical protein